MIWNKEDQIEIRQAERSKNRYDEPQITNADKPKEIEK
jgi:hypothetical protein